MQTPGTPKESKRTLLIVFSTIFLDLVGFGIIIPIQPFFAETLGASPAMVTLLGASFSLMQFLFAPFWGRLSDRVGRRPVMLTSIAVTAVGYLGFALAKELPFLFAARMLAGFGSANIGTAQAIIADSTTAETRAKGMGLIGAAFGLGFIFGPAIGGGLSQFGLAAPAFVAAAFSFINWIFAFCYLPETLRKGEGKVSVTSHPALSFLALKHASRHPNVAQLFVLYLIFPVAFSLMEQVLGLFIEATWLGGASAGSHARKAAALTATVLMVVGITSTIVQGGLIGRLARRFGERKLLMVGLTLMGFCFIAIPVVGIVEAPFLALLPVCGLLAVGSALTSPSLSSLLSQSVERDEQGTALGLGQSLAALGRVVGPASAGVLFQYYRGLPFWCGSTLLFFCSMVAVTIRKERVAPVS